MCSDLKKLTMMFAMRKKVQFSAALRVVGKRRYYYISHKNL
jgi:hypothetical protein